MLPLDANTALYDISPRISEHSAVYPGDVAYIQKPAKSYAAGDAYALSSIATTLHIGAHTDAPFHYHRDGQTIDALSLSPYLGACQVVDVSNMGVIDKIQPEHLAHVTLTAPRVLFKTLSFPDPNQWRDDFFAVAPETLDYLADHNVVLVGIDTPSFDLAHDSVLSAHAKLFEHKMMNLEGLVLQDVPAETYILIALPLNLQNAEASPVRAVLLSQS